MLNLLLHVLTVWKAKRWAFSWFWRFTSPLAHPIETKKFFLLHVQTWSAIGVATNNSYAARTTYYYCNHCKIQLCGFCFFRMWQKILTCSLWVPSCANLKTRAFRLGFFGLTSHKWFLKQEELTSSLWSAFRFPDCIVKQREPVSAHTDRVILVGRDILRSPGQATLRAGPTRSGCSGLSRYFSISKDSPSGFLLRCLTTPWWKFFLLSPFAFPC